jgi:hypothetical protein
MGPCAVFRINLLLIQFEYRFLTHVDHRKAHNYFGIACFLPRPSAN